MECCVCFQPRPGFTPCGHPVCRLCLEQLTRPICPICRHKFAASQPSTPPPVRSSTPVELAHRQQDRVSAPTVTAWAASINKERKDQLFLAAFVRSAIREPKETATRECLQLLNNEGLTHLRCDLNATLAAGSSGSEQLGRTWCGWFTREGEAGGIDGATVLHIAALNSLTEVCQAIVARPDFTRADAFATFRWKDGRICRQLTASAIVKQLGQSLRQPLPSTEAVRAAAQLVNIIDRGLYRQSPAHSSNRVQLRHNQSSPPSRSSTDRNNRSDEFIRSQNERPLLRSQSQPNQLTSQHARRSPPSRSSRDRNDRSFEFSRAQNERALSRSQSQPSQLTSQHARRPQNEMLDYNGIPGGWGRPRQQFEDRRTWSNSSDRLPPLRFS